MFYTQHVCMCVFGNLECVTLMILLLPLFSPLGYQLFLLGLKVLRSRKIFLNITIVVIVMSEGKTAPKCDIIIEGKILKSVMSNVWEKIIFYA